MGLLLGRELASVWERVLASVWVRASAPGVGWALQRWRSGLGWLQGEAPLERVSGMELARELGMA